MKSGLFAYLISLASFCVLTAQGSPVELLVGGHEDEIQHFSLPIVKHEIPNVETICNLNITMKD